MRIALVLAILIAALTATACGGDDSGGGGETSLTIVYWEDGDRPDSSETWILDCNPSGGDHPEPEEACAVLDSAGRAAFEPVPDGTACAEIFGGPQRAEVSGTLDGETVEATFDRHNGCEMERWDRLEGLLPAVT